MVLAVSDEAEEKVAEYVDNMGITVRTAAGFSTGGDWGVRAYPSAALINPEGEVVWTGHPGSLSKGKVKDALKGAKGSSGGYLGYTTSEELDNSLKKAVKEAAAGKLGKAYAEAKKVAANEKLAQPVRDEAEAFAGELSDFAGLLNKQAEGLIEKGMVLKGIAVIEDLVGVTKGMPVEQDVVARLKEIEGDEALQNEIAAAEALQKAVDAIQKRGFKKSKKKLEAVVDKYPGTKAAERATKRLRAKK